MPAGPDYNSNAQIQGTPLAAAVRAMQPDAGVGPRPDDARTLSQAAEVLAQSSARLSLSRLLPFLGPAFVAAVAYVDPGNFATNIQAGSEFGYRLVWVILASNLMAMLIQALSAKLGMATGKNLAEVCRDRLPRLLVYAMCVLMEIERSHGYRSCRVPWRGARVQPSIPHAAHLGGGPDGAGHLCHPGFGSTRIPPSRRPDHFYGWCDRSCLHY